MGQSRSIPIFSDDGRLVPNKRTNRLNGEQVDTSQNDHVVDTDPTGAFFFDKHGGPHQMSEATLAKIDESKATPTPTPVPRLVREDYKPLCRPLAYRERRQPRRQFPLQRRHRLHKERYTLLRNNRHLIDS